MRASDRNFEGQRCALAVWTERIELSQQVFSLDAWFGLANSSGCTTHTWGSGVRAEWQIDRPHRIFSNDFRPEHFPERSRQTCHCSWCETLIANTAAIGVHGRGRSRFLAARAGDGFGTRCASAVRWQNFDFAFRQSIGFGLFHDDAPFCDTAQMGSSKMNARP